MASKCVELDQWYLQCPEFIQDLLYQRHIHLSDPSFQNKTKKIIRSLVGLKRMEDFGSPPNMIGTPRQAFTATSKGEP